ncbi:MAG: XrtA/PEP-CTERM system TPR-repeat protein PrsT, partial [Burkholderiaceae bacterium]
KLLAAAPNNHEALKFKGELLLYAKNEPDAALEQFKKAVEAKPDFAQAYAGILTILLSREKLDEAEKTLSQLKRVAPNIAETRYFDAQLAYQKKDYRTAKEAIQQLLKVAPENARFLQLAGAIEFQTNSLVQAEYYLGKALQLAPNQQFARRMLVATYLRSGEAAKAVAALPASIEQESKDAELLSLAGQAYLQSGDVKKSEALFSRATKADPNSVGKRTSLAVAQLMGGKTELAMGELRDIAESDSGTGANLELISAYLRRGEFEKALSAIDQLVKKDPKSPTPSHLRGSTYLALKDVAAARRHFEKAVSLDPTFFPSAASLAALDLSDKKPEDATARFEAILKQDPKHLQAMLALADIKARTGGTVEEVAKLLNNAIRANQTELVPRRALIEYYLRNREYKLALATAQTALSVIPESPELLDALGRAQQGSGEANQAIATFNRLAGMRPDSPQAQMRLAGSYLLEKNPKAAEQAWRQALKIQPDFVDAQRALIIFYLQAEKYQDALAIARTVQEQRPKEPVGWLLEGDIGVARKKWDDAAVAYRAGLKKFPSTDLAIKLHSVLYAAEKHADAASAAKAWLSDHSKDTAFIGYLGNLALVKKDYAAAEKNYREVLRLQPQNALALNNLAWASVEQKKKGAVEQAEKANKLVPDRPSFMDTLALALSQSGEHARAVEVQKKAIGLQPNNPYLNFHLAKIYLNAGDKKNARVELDRLAAMGEKFPLQQQVTTMKAEL